MAIKKSNFTGLNGRKMLHSPVQAYVPAVALIEHTFSEAVAAADILELCVLPPYCRVISAEILSVGTATATADVGFMSGTPLSSDPARTVGAEIYDDVLPTTATAATMAKIVAAGMKPEARSIGVKFSEDVAAAPATKLHLKLTYATGAYA